MRTGSSPRGRGTLTCATCLAKLTRFIPAWAGNTRWRGSTPLPVPVHPRVGGEHNFDLRAASITDGSSPRGRGTRRWAECLEAVFRFIPAWAGNTYSRSAFITAVPVHPRVGGEHVSAGQRDAMQRGSSPRGRGTHAINDLADRLMRFIPAWAGNTFLDWLSSMYSGGSSPRGRGTHMESWIVGNGGRFIPAWAGNTRTLLF